jgi:hypothetical protein
MSARSAGESQGLAGKSRSTLAGGIFALSLAYFWRFVPNSHDDMKYLAPRAEKAMSVAAHLLVIRRRGFSFGGTSPALVSKICGGLGCSAAIERPE